MSRVHNPCVDCRFSKANYGFECAKSELELAHPVLGSTRLACFDLRQKGQACGPEGRHFEKRPPKRSFLQRIQEAFTSDGF